MPNRNNKGKCPAKGPPQKKVKTIKKNKRHTFTLEQKNHARDLRKEGKEPNEIIKIFEQIYDVKVKPSTLATWYNKSNMARHEQMGPTNTSMASVETHINPSQRPTIMIDMEFALVQQIKKSNNAGTVTTKATLQNMGKTLFNKLRTLNIYNDSGERLKPLSELTEARINTLMEDASKKKTILCPLCNAPIRPDSDNSENGDTLFEHVRDYHSQDKPDGEPKQPPSQDKPDGEPKQPPPRVVYMFKGSDGWARNLLKRQNLHSVRTVGEMGSNNQVSAKDFVDKFRDELIGRRIAPKKIVRILLNIDETGIVYKSVPKRTYKFIGTPFMAKKSFKDRVTVLVGASMDGLIKLKPVVVGKAKQPRALKGVNRSQLPVHYYGQASAWMSQEIMNHWFHHHLDPELKAHYGDDAEVILTIDNAGCHPPDLNSNLDYVEVRYLPPNTTAVIQPMDQGVIHVFKKNFMDIYYNKMIDYLLQHGGDDDPMSHFPSTYTMKDVLIDIGQAWERVEVQHIHKCFENLINPDEYLKHWNETYNEDVQWSGVNFRGFHDTPNDNSATETADRLQKIKELVRGLHTRIEGLPELQRVDIDCDSVEEAIHYDPNDDLEDTEELITLGFLSQRGAEGFESEDNERDIPHEANEALKALTNLEVTFRTQDFESKEQAEQASTYLKDLQKIFIKMKYPTKSTIPTPTPPRPASRPPSPQPGTSGFTTIRPSTERSVPAQNLSLEEINYVNVLLDDEDPAAHGDAADGDAVDDAADAYADGDAAASNTSYVLPGYVTDSAAAARAVAATAKNLLNVSTSSSSTITLEYAGEEVEISRFTPLNVNPKMTSSPRQGRTGSGSRSSPSPTPPRGRPKRVRPSQFRYAEYSSDVDMSTSGDDEYDPKDAEK